MKKKTPGAKAKKNNFYLTLAIAVVALIGVFIWANWQTGKAPTIKTYFFKDEKLFAVERKQNPDLPPLKQAIEELLAGPTQQEQRDGVSTMLPAGVKLIQVKTDKTVAIIDLGKQLEDYGGGSAKVEGIVAQIVYTATAIPGIDKAWIWVEGQHEVVLGGEGLVLDHPLGRQDVKD